MIKYCWCSCLLIELQIFRSQIISSKISVVRRAKQYRETAILLMFCFAIPAEDVSAVTTLCVMSKNIESKTWLESGSGGRGAVWVRGSEARHFLIRPSHEVIQGCLKCLTLYFVVRCLLMKTVSKKVFTTLCTWIRGWVLYRGGFYAVQNSANKRSHMRVARQGQGGVDSLVSRAGHVLARYRG